ncbi:glycosyl hydrolase family 18 protein [Roseivirga sp. BDSF3-8]|uniref:glycosyl hydrolase family 18 protein n=1 Tax=Roseivirga sp. BDSF3-8 TaxID=3241598 RepID=UPI003531818D
MKKHALLLVMLCACVLGGHSASAQETLKQQFDEYIDAKKPESPVVVESDNTSQEKAMSGVDTATMQAAITPDTVAISGEEADTAFIDQEGETVGLQADTTAFISRNLAVKERSSQEKDASEAEYDKQLYLTHNKAYKKIHKRDTTRSVFGWHPYWMGSAFKSYNFDILSTVAYFSYELNPATGGYYSIHNWRKTELIDSAHAHGCKVVLSVTNFGQNNNRKFLENRSAQQHFINNLITLLRERNGDGVNLDFENIPASQRTNLTNFIIDLSNSLTRQRKDYLITIALPAVDFGNVYNLPQLTKYVDMFVIMGYEYHGSNSKVAGPVAPLASGGKWGPFDLEKSVDAYLLSGVSPDKLILGLPYYGAEWTTKDLKFPSTVGRFVGNPTYRHIRQRHGEPRCCDDEISASAYYAYRNNGNQYRQIWYEDSTSLAKKYDYIIENKLGGVGIWALGYDHGYTDLWKLLAAKFTLQAPQKAQASSKALSRFSFRRIMYMAMRFINNPARFLSNPRPLLMIFGSLFGVSMFGFFMLYRFGCRLKRGTNLAVKGGVAFFIILMVAVVFIALQYTGVREIAYLLGGLLLGTIIFFAFSRRYLSEKDLP